MADPVYPVAKFTIPRTGHFGSVRRSPRDGGCGLHGYPCKHPGTDLAAPVNTPVVAPHDGWILAAVMAPKDAKLPAPFEGYEPGVVLIAHDDVTDPWWKKFQGNLLKGQLFTPAAQSARYSLLGHVVTPFDLPLDARVWHEEDHSNWRELADGTLVMTFQPGNGRDVVGTNPNARYVHAGDTVGYIGPTSHGHTHWELRTRPVVPVGDMTHRLDAMEVWNKYYGVGKPAADDDSGNAWLWLLVAGAILSERD
jgi:hypothetical protein